MKFRFLVVGYMSGLWAGKILPRSKLKLLYLVLKACTKNEVHDWKYLFLNWLNDLHLSHTTVIKMAILFQLLMLIPKKLLIIFFFLIQSFIMDFFSPCVVLLFSLKRWVISENLKIYFSQLFYMIKKQFLQTEEALTNLITFLLHVVRILVWFWRGL